MGFVLGNASIDRLIGVHPHLIRVVKRAITITPVDFKVIEGLRPPERCYENFGKGRTAAQCVAAGVPARYSKPSLAKVTWLKDPLNSKHCKQADGLSHAVDLLVAPYDWKEGPQWKQMASAVLAAARLEGVSIRWGRDWDRDGIVGEKGETDGPHFELC